MTIDPEISAETSTYIAARTTALRHEFSSASGAVQLKMPGESTPARDLDQLAETFSFLTDLFFSSASVALCLEAKTGVCPNELDFRVHHVFLIAFELSSASQGWTCLEAGVPTPSTEPVDKISTELILQWEKTLPAAPHPKVIKAQESFAQRMRDRKSTRLNSSHIP